MHEAIFYSLSVEKHGPDNQTARPHGKWQLTKWYQNCLSTDLAGEDPGTWPQTSRTAAARGLAGEQGLPQLSLLPVFTWGAEAQLEARKRFLTSFRESRFEWDFGEFSIGESRTWTPFCLVWTG